MTYLRRVTMTALNFGFISLLVSFEGATSTHKNEFINKAYLKFKGLFDKGLSKEENQAGNG